MQIRQPVHSDHARTLDTEGLRRHFLVEDLFVADNVTLTYSQIDRIIVGGIMPVSKPVTFAAELGKHTGTDFFLQRRELGLINIGGAARVTVDGAVYEIGGPTEDNPGYDLPGLVVGCLPGMVTGAGIGGVAGTILAGGGTAVVAGLDLIKVLNAPAGTTLFQ